MFMYLFNKNIYMQATVKLNTEVNHKLIGSLI